MTATQLTPEAKEALRKTIRTLRPRLIDKLREAVKGEYRLDIDSKKARLPEDRRCKRERLDQLRDEQLRSVQKGGKPTEKETEELRAGFLEEAVTEAAHTWLNRLVILRILEQHELVTPAVLTGGWKSPAYEQEYVHYAGPLVQDDTRGYRDLLDIVFGELARELPGLYGPVGLIELVPMPAALLREMVEALNDPTLDSAWGDETTLGWIYQYWNDPERERLDAKIADGGKIEPHEIACKTQMYTERYMVEWLLQNSLGLTWLCICKKNGWVPDAERVLPSLDARRADWRKKREAGKVALDALMPIHGPLEDAWKYYVPQPIPEDAIAKAPASIRELKLLEPACGSGHFLVSAFGMLVAMYAEEAKHRGETWSNEQIAESILANNLHGIDIDPRAIQLAAAALWLKAKLYAPKATLGRMNLVAPCFKLASLPKDDPAVVKLYAELAALGVPAETTRKLVDSLGGVDHLGTLLHVDRAIGDLVDDTGKQWGTLFAKSAAKKKVALEGAITQFLDAHSTEAELGLRLEGEQLAAGLRFVELVKDGTYDIVVGNPPYQGLNKATNFEYVAKNYPRAKADLYSAFLQRNLELCRPGGLSAMVTMQGWMFLGQFAELRQLVIEQNRLRSLVDLRWCAFENMRHATISMVVVSRGTGCAGVSVALCPTPREEREESIPALAKKRAAVLAQAGRYEFDPKGFAVIEGEPIVYWWTKEFLEKYARLPKLGELSAVRQGMATGDNTWHLRCAWEVRRSETALLPVSRADCGMALAKWVPYVKGADGRSWYETVSEVVRWSPNGLGIKTMERDGTQTSRPQNESYYFKRGVAFSSTGASCRARCHCYQSVFDVKGQSVFPTRPFETCAAMNTSQSGDVLAALNPTISFQVGDAKRLPIGTIVGLEKIERCLHSAFTEHESHREPSVEFRSPGPSPWRYAQDWAQRAVDRADGEPLPPYHAEYDDPAPESYVSFAIGVALGRFGANNDGILDVALDTALPAGILFVGPSDTMPDSVSHPATVPIVTAWDRRQNQICADKKQSLREWLHKDFFTYHKALYENRPIYFPLSSEKRSFVAYVSIHRWVDNTLQTLLADHLNPALRQLEGEIADLKQARASSDKKAAATAEKQYAATKRLHDELTEFIAAVTECAERGAPPTDPKCPARAVKATFRMDLDDGVMINSAALWPLLEPQWKDPKKWWKELCTAEGRKDYDWAHLARRYFPKRVEEKCVTDPSLAVAHGCFWKYHPAKAYAWELRLQDEIRPDFLIEEDDASAARKRYLKENKAEAKEILEKEMVRRERKALKADADEADPAQDVEETEEDESKAPRMPAPVSARRASGKTVEKVAAKPIKGLHSARPRPSSSTPVPLKKARERAPSAHKSSSRLKAAAKRAG